MHSIISRCNINICMQISGRIVVIQNKFKYSVFLAASLLLVSCSGIDSNQIEIVSSNESTSEDINIADDATTEVTDISVEKIAEEVPDAQSGDFYYVELDYDKEESIDIGNDGRMILFF